MRDTYLKILLLIVLMLTPAVCAETLEVEIGNQLSALGEAETPEQVDAIVDEAKEYLRANRTRTNDVTWGFLKADVTQAQGRVYTDFWLADKTNQELGDKARGFLQNSIAQYEDLSDQADDSADTIAGRLRGSAQRSSRWREFAGYPSRANYSRAWSYYTLGLLDELGKESNENLLQAIELFEPFMRGGYSENRIVQDCFLGYGLCLYEMGKLGQAADLLNESRITPANTTGDFLKQITLLRMRICEKMNHPLGGEWAGRLYFQQRPKEAGDYDRAEVEIAFKRIAALAQLSRSTDGAPYASNYRQRLDDFRRQFAASQPQWNAKVAQVLSAAGVETATGYLRKAKESYDSQQYRQALALTLAGLELTDPSFEPEALVDLRYFECLCLNELAQPDALVTVALSFLSDYPEDVRVAMVSRIAMESAIEVVKAGGVITDDAFDRLADAYASGGDDDRQDWLRWYRASFYAAAGRFAEAEAMLRGIAPDGAVTLRCLYLRCFAAYQQSRTGDAEGLIRAFGTVTEFGRTLEMSSPQAWVCAGMFDVALAVMDELVQGEVAIAEPMMLVEAVEAFPCIDPARGQKFLAAKIRFYAKFNELDRLRDILGKLKQKRADVSLNESLLIAAELLTADLEDAEATQGRSSLAAEVFRFLLKATDKSENAALYGEILWKLAESLRRAGRFEQAIERYEALLKVDAPRVQTRVKRGLAVSYQAIEQYDTAAAHWRFLSRTLARETTGWYEANYELIACTRRAGNVERAEQLLAYFRLKNPGSLPAEWAEKFDQLEGGDGP